MEQLCLQQPELEGLLRGARQDLDVAVVDELQHGAEEAAHLCLTRLLGDCLKAHWLNLHCMSLLSKHHAHVRDDSIAQCVWSSHHGTAGAVCKEPLIRMQISGRRC